MKTFLTISIFLNALLSCAQTINKDLPLIKARAIKADYKIGDDRVNGSWNISPEIAYDSLFVWCTSPTEKFTFYTDCDSISFDIKLNEVHSFYVLLNDTAHALTVVQGVNPGFTTLAFDKESKNAGLQFWYEENKNNQYLNTLRAKYPIDSIVKDAKNDTERAMKITNWVHNQWKHNGSNTPQKSDAISILEEVKSGKNFRCVEYGIVTSACLNAIGLKARTLGLRMKDVETIRSGAGHVLLEVYMNDLKKWVMLDGQWDAMPVLNDVPLNAVEFQKAIAEHYDQLQIRSLSGTPKRHYVKWIYPYLYYFTFSFDNREGIETRNKVQDKLALMLVPSGAKNPTIFQINSKIDYCLYTNSINDFYGKP